MPLNQRLVVASLPLLGIVASAGCRGDKDAAHESDDSGEPRDTSPADDTGDSPPDTGPFDRDGDDSPDGEDCAPDDPSVYPGAEELCGDQLVNDCAGDEASAAEACGLEGRVDVTQVAGAVFVGTERWEVVGVHIAGLGDQDGDGIDDLLIAASIDYTESSAPDARLFGAIFVGSGAAQGSNPLPGESAEGVVVPSWTDDLFLDWPTGPGDLDNDGYPDLAVGAWLYDKACSEQPGQVFVVPGPILGEVTLPASASGTWTGETETACAGYRMSSVGDTNGDELPDLLVGAPCDISPAGGQGLAYVVYGPATGSHTLSESEVGARILSDQAALLGEYMAGPGDVDGDGIPDVIFGDPYYPTHSTDNYGRVLLMLGPFAGTLDAEDADSQLFGIRPNDYAGIGLDGAGDQNGDGYADLIIGAPGYTTVRSNQAYVVNGPPAASLDLADADATINPSSAEERGAGVGFTVAGLRDLNADGVEDVGVTISYIDTVDPYYVGRAYLFLAPLLGQVYTTDAWSTLYRDSDLTSVLGEQLFGLGDTNGDGLGDVVISDPSFSPESGTSEEVRTAGAVFLLRDGAW